MQSLREVITKTLKMTEQIKKVVAALVMINGCRQPSEYTRVHAHTQIEK